MDIAFSPAPFLQNARIYFIAFGAVSIVGGIMAFVKAHSRASLIAGSISGILLIVGGVLLGFSRPSLTAGATLTSLISLALLGRFLPALLRDKKMPAAYMTPLAAVGVVWGAMILVAALSPG